MEDLRSFIENLSKEDPSQVLKISDKVPVDFTTTALSFQLDKIGRNPLILLESVEEFKDFSIAANIFASKDLVASSLGITKEKIYPYFGKCLDSLIPAELTKTGPVQEIVFKGDDIDLGKLPIPLHFENDAGAYITAGMVAAQDPDTSIGNLAYARLQVKGPRRLGVSLHSRQHLWDYFERAKKAGKDLPVAVVIGAHPAVMLAAAAKMGIDQDEYDLAGALMGQPLEICKAQTVDVNVPAMSEIVIEGILLADTFEPEGPFGEYTGYSTGRSTNNVLEVTAITMKKDPIYVDIIPGNSAEHLILGGISKQAWVYQRMKEALPFFLDFHYPPSGTHFHAFVRIKKTAEGQPQQAAQLMFGLDHYLKMVVVVDEDVDQSNESDVLWAMATRMQADKDVSIVSNALCNLLDPSSEDGVGAKMAIDATRKLDKDMIRISIPDSADELVKELIRSESNHE